MRLAALFCGAIVSCAAGAAGAHTFKLSTWNLNWLTTRTAEQADLPEDVRPRHADDFARLRGFAQHLASDVVALEEVDGVDAAGRLFDPAAYSLLTIDEDVVQRVGLAVRRGIAVQRHADVSALDVEAGAPHRLRDGLDATLVFAGGASLRVLVLHLKTGCQRDDLQRSTRPQCALLSEQVPVVAAWVRARAAAGEAFAVMGDFNREMDGPDSVQDTLQAAAPMLRVTQGHSNPCWNGGAFIDHIFLGGPARGWQIAGSLRVMTYKSGDERDRARLSDHCPVSVMIDPK